MDPIETFNQMMLAREEGDWHSAVEYARYLQEWLDRGGFVPLFQISADERLHFKLREEEVALVLRDLIQAIIDREDIPIQMPPSP